MSTEAVSPLRRRMIEDMTIRQFGEHTKKRLHPPGQGVRGLPRPLA